MAITRVIYIVFPTHAIPLFKTRGRCLVAALIPVAFGMMYAFPSLNECCYRFYRFTSYAMSYVGPQSGVQLKFSITASALFILTESICYTWVIWSLKKKAAVQARKKEQRGRRTVAARNDRKEKKVP